MKIINLPYGTMKNINLPYGTTIRTKSINLPYGRPTDYKYWRRLHERWVSIQTGTSWALSVDTNRLPDSDNSAPHGFQQEGSHMLGQVWTHGDDESSSDHGDWPCFRREERCPWFGRFRKFLPKDRVWVPQRCPLDDLRLYWTGSLLVCCTCL